MADQSAEEIAQFDPEYRIFRNPNGDSFSEQQVIAGTPVAPGHPEVIWRGIRVTIPTYSYALCWKPYSIGDRFVHLPEGNGYQDMVITKIKVCIAAEGSIFLYCFDDEQIHSHQTICSLVDQGCFRVVVAGGAE